MASIKVLWMNKGKEEVTWEAKEDMKSRYPHLFCTMGDNNESIMMGHDSTFEDEYFEGGDDVTPNI